MYIESYSKRDEHTTINQQRSTNNDQPTTNTPISPTRILVNVTNQTPWMKAGDIGGY